MQIYAVVVVESEDDASQGIAFASTLHDMIVVAHHHVGCYERGTDYLARLALTHKIVVTFEVAHIACMMAHRCLYDALGNNPLRIEVNALDASCEQRCLRLHTAKRYAHSNPIVLFNRLKLLRRHVDQHILVVQLRIVAMTPAATLYIAEHPTSFGSRQRTRQHLAEFGIKRIFWIRGLHESPHLLAA